jgi:hypothetical protein
MKQFWLLTKQAWQRIPTQQIRVWVRDHMPAVSASALQLTAVVLLHAATLPSYISVMLAWTDTMPPLDMVILVWAGIACLFAQAMVQRNNLMIATVAVGFMLQSMFMALIFFR